MKKIECIYIRTQDIKKTSNTYCRTVLDKKTSFATEIIAILSKPQKDLKMKIQFMQERML